MKPRGAALLAPFVLLGAGNAQEPLLGPPVALDVRVKTVQWHPHGNALLYSREESDGIGIGVYELGAKEANVLLRLKEGDRWEAQWLEGHSAVIVIVYRPLRGPEGEKTEALVHILNPKSGTDKIVFSRVFDAKERPDLDVDTSPSLFHAIFRLKHGEERHHLVLPGVGNVLIASPDLDRAQKEGFSGPVWTVDGTAVFRKGSGASFEDASLPLYFKQAAGKPGVFEVALIVEKEKAVLTGVYANAVLRFVSPPPPVGTPVLELMPFNAALRQVRFKGAWQAREPALGPLGMKQQPAGVDLGLSRGLASTLWLTRGEEKPNRGELVSPHAEKGWIAPRHRAVAYLTDGALFVRKIQR